MSVRIVRLRSGEDVIADVYEIAAQEDPKKAVAFRLDHPYSVYLDEGNELLVETEGVQKMSKPELTMQPWAPLAKDRKVVLRLDEVISAYQTFDEVIEKYNEILEALNGRGNGTSTTGVSDGVGDDTGTGESNPVETKEGIPVGESDGAGRGAKPVNRELLSD